MGRDEVALEYKRYCLQESVENTGCRTRGEGGHMTIHTISLICTGIVIGMVLGELYNEWRNSKP